MLSWKLAILLSATIIMGCSSKTTVDTSELAQPDPVHPSWPRPYEKCTSPDIKVGTDSTLGSVVTIPYNQYLDKLSCDQDKLRYTSGLLNMVCFYRKDLQEPICSQLYPVEKEEVKE